MTTSFSSMYLHTHMQGFVKPWYLKNVVKFFFGIYSFWQFKQFKPFKQFKLFKPFKQHQNTFA